MPGEVRDAMASWAGGGRGAIASMSVGGRGIVVIVEGVLSHSCCNYGAGSGLA